MGHFVAIKKGKVTHVFVLLRILKTTLRFSDFLGLGGLRRAFLLILPVYYRRSIPIKVSRGKRCTEWSQKKPGTSCQLFSPRGVTWTGLHLPAVMWQHREVLPTQGSSPKPWYPWLFLQVSHTELLWDYLSCSVSSFPEVKLTPPSS